MEPLTVGREPDALLFGTLTGQFRSLACWKRDSRYFQHSRGRTVKDLRHSFATNSLSVGTDTRIVQGWLGHWSATMMQDIYGRWIGSDAETVALARLSEAWASKTVGWGAEKPESGGPGDFPVVHWWAIPDSNR